MELAALNGLRVGTNAKLKGAPRGFVGLALAMCLIGKGFSMEAVDAGRLSRFIGGNTLVVMRGASSTFIHFEVTGKAQVAVDRTFALSEGDWWVESGKVCMRQTAPVPPGPAPEANCLAVPVMTFEQTWQIDDNVDGRLRYRWIQGSTWHFQPPPKVVR